jgi:hypothetical protein
MPFLKKAVGYLWRYILGILIAILACGILALIFKVTLITVQGPTKVSRISEVATFYSTLSLAFFFLFRHYGTKQALLNLKEFSLYAGLIVVLHVVIAIGASWSILWFISTGALTLAIFIYTGGSGIVESLTEVPRMYYFIALAIEDICFIVFSLIGYCKGIRK